LFDFVRDPLVNNTTHYIMSLKDKPVRPGEYAVILPTISAAEEPEHDNDNKEGSSESEKKEHRKDERERERKEGKEGRSKESKKTSCSKLSSLNAQLVAHGYTKRSLRLDALSSSDQAQVASVIADLLNASSVSDNTAQLLRSILPTAANPPHRPRCPLWKTPMRA
jgi:hypothetical protein